MSTQYSDRDSDTMRAFKRTTKAANIEVLEMSTQDEKYRKEASEKWEEYRVSRLPYTTHFAPITYEKGYILACEIRQKEIEQLRAEKASLNSRIADDRIVHMREMKKLRAHVKAARPWVKQAEIYSNFQNEIDDILEWLEDTKGVE